ncbi:hypothetical protein ACVILH_004293 [Bradyrhizobium sp. USDA 4353]
MRNGRRTLSLVGRPHPRCPTPLTLPSPQFTDDLHDKARPTWPGFHHRYLHTRAAPNRGSLRSDNFLDFVSPFRRLLVLAEESRQAVAPFALSCRCDIGL